MTAVFPNDQILLLKLGQKLLSQAVPLLRFLVSPLTVKVTLE